MGRVNFLGHNVKAYWFMIWEVDNHLVVLQRALMGGMFFKIIDPKGEPVLEWPTTYNLQIMAMQANYLIEQTLQGNAAWLRAVAMRKGFSVNLPAGSDDQDPAIRKMIADQMVEWVNKTFGTLLDSYEDHYPYVKITDFNVDEMQMALKEIDAQLVFDFRNEHRPKKRKLRKVEDEDSPDDVEMTDNPEDMYKEATKDVEGDHNEWADKFED